MVNHPNRSRPLRESNAELLAALKRAVYLLDEIHSGNVYSEDFMWREVEKALAVIDKAEGRS
jgi:hypothetical protein